VVLRKASWLVGFGVLIGRLDSILFDYRHEEFFVYFFSSIDGLFFALRWCFCSSTSYLWETQLLDLPRTIRALEPILHV